MQKKNCIWKVELLDTGFRSENASYLTENKLITSWFSNLKRIYFLLVKNSFFIESSRWVERESFCVLIKNTVLNLEKNWVGNKVSKVNKWIETNDRHLSKQIKLQSICWLPWKTKYWKCVFCSRLRNSFQTLIDYCTLSQAKQVLVYPIRYY